MPAADELRFLCTGKPHYGGRTCWLPCQRGCGRLRKHGPFDCPPRCGCKSSLRRPSAPCALRCSGDVRAQPRVVCAHQGRVCGRDIVSISHLRLVAQRRGFADAPTHATTLGIYSLPRQMGGDASCGMQLCRTLAAFILRRRCVIACAYWVGCSEHGAFCGFCRAHVGGCRCPD